LLLSLDHAATVKDLRSAVEQATGVSTTECTIHRSSSSRLALNNNRGVFSSDADSLTWTDKICRYWLRRKARPPEGEDKDGQIQIDIKRTPGDQVTIRCRRGITVHRLQGLLQEQEAIPTFTFHVLLMERRGVCLLPSEHELKENINNVRIWFTASERSHLSLLYLFIYFLLFLNFF
jgi:hypothetical protein